MDKTKLDEMKEKPVKWINKEEGGEKAVLVGAALQEADLRGAALQSADLRGADLQEANLWEADLRWADLEGTALKGANLNYAKISLNDFWINYIKENL